jgi:outer membrane lipoprotein SlyB
MRMPSYRTLHGNIAAGLIALAALLPLAIFPVTAQAQQSERYNSTPRIDGFDVVSVRQLTSGSDLLFTLYGSAGGTATVQIGGATESLPLAEIEAGVYEGAYTINSRDRIARDSTATANLRLGNRVATSILDDSLVTGAGPRWPGGTGSASGTPKIDRFDVNPPNNLVAGSELLFTLEGTPDASASVRINGVRGKLALEQVRPGVYEGSYPIKNRDRIAPDSVVTGNLRLGSKEQSKVLSQSLVDNSSSRPRERDRRADSPRYQEQRAAAPMCSNCGVIESVNLVEVKGDGSYVGMIGGGVIGALLGGQVAHRGSGKTVAQVAGAAGGAWAGNEIEKKVRSTKHYEVVVRLENGGSQTVSYASQPGLSVGTRVRVENGALVTL